MEYAFNNVRVELEGETHAFNYRYTETDKSVNRPTRGAETALNVMVPGDVNKSYKTKLS